MSAEDQQKFQMDNNEHASGEDHDGNDSDSDDKRKGRRKIDISFIENKSRRHITFSKRKAGIMKKAYELATLTGTQVLLLVASETGHVYTFATPKLQPLITNPEGKNLIQACLNAPDQSTPEPPKPVPVAPPAPPQAYAATPEPDRNKSFPQSYPNQGIPQQQSPQMGYDPKYVRPKPEPMRQMEDPRNMNYPQQPMGMPQMQGHPGTLPGYPGMPPAQYQNSQFFQPRQGPQGQPGNPMSGFPGQGQPQQQQGQQMQHPGGLPNMTQAQAQMYQNYGRPQQQQQAQPQIAGFPTMYQMRPQVHLDQGGQDGQEGSDDE